MIALAGAPAVAQTAIPAPPDAVVLRPGEFVWYEDARPQRAAAGGSDISIIVSIPAQLAYVYRDDRLIAVSTVSTGMPGKDTPVGEFTVLQKQVFHRSNLYSAAPMPWMQRLTWDGIAMHAGHLPGYPASHGCIRLPKDFAKQLYQVTAVGIAVSVIDAPLDDPWNGRGGMRPVLAVDMASLNGAGWDEVTIDLQPREGGEGWVLGPMREVVQPIPTGKR